MKIILVAVLTLAAWASAEDLAHKQQAINRLLYKITEPIQSKFEDLHNAAHSYDPRDNTDNCHDGGDAVHKLMREINDHRVLERHHWFSLFNTRQREEALMLFHVLATCKNFESFKNNAAFFREKMNEGEFVYALYVAVTHSEHTQGVILPPLYEITPHMFTNSEVVQKAYSAKMTQQNGNFYMNFTGSQKNPEQRVAYFGEDIGMNSHHVHWHMDFPFWWDGHKIDRKGELFFWAHHQLTARFDAERLSNNLPVVNELYWDKPIREGFAPHTTYRYGGEFPSRPDNKIFEDVEGVAKVRDLKEMESRIRDAIAHGYFNDKEGKVVDIMNEKGIDILGNAIESSTYSPHSEYYGALHNYAHIMLGRQADPRGKFNMPPGVMEHFETATRDPAFFRLHKYMNNIFKEHKDSLPPYTHDELIYDNAEITNLEIEGDLVTFFDDYKFDLSMGLDGNENTPDVEVTAEVSRLNHQPFTYHIEVNANHDEVATFRIFFCPKYDYNHIEMRVDEVRWQCIEMDKFWHKLSAGSNTVLRKSSESSVTIDDRMHYSELIKKADEAVAGGSDLPHSTEHRACGHPHRMLLPKGKPEGMDFEYFVAITSGEDAIYDDMADNEHGSTHAYCGIQGQEYPDKRPMGFPLDRRVPNDRAFKVPNIKWETVSIHHKESHHH